MYRILQILSQASCCFHLDLLLWTAQFCELILYKLQAGKTLYNIYHLPTHNHTAWFRFSEKKASAHKPTQKSQVDVYAVYAGFQHYLFSLYFLLLRQTKHTCFQFLQVWQNLLNDGCLLNATSLVSLSGFLENCSTHLSHCNVVDRVAYASDLCSSTFVDLMKQSIANIRIKQWRALLAVRQGHKHNTSLLSK